MTHRLVSTCALVVATACFSHASNAVTLYTPALRTTPGQQGWIESTNGASASGVSGSAWRLDTTADAAMSAGAGLLGTAPVIDTAGGVTLGFGLQVLTELHLTADRAGFSVIAVGSNPANAIELAFWGDRIWAYTGSFAHGVEVLYDTSAAHNYTLTLQNQRFALASDGTGLLSGALVDYRATGLPYVVANTIVFGDDTSRAAASVAVGTITLSPVPEPATAGLFLLGGALIAVRRRRGRAGNAAC